MKPNKTAILRTRVEEGWKSDFEVFARALKMDMSDIVRLACTEIMLRPSQFKRLSLGKSRHGLNR